MRKHVLDFQTTSDANCAILLQKASVLDFSDLACRNLHICNMCKNKGASLPLCFYANRL